MIEAMAISKCVWGIGAMGYGPFLVSFEIFPEVVCVKSSQVYT